MRIKIVNREQRASRKDKHSSENIFKMAMKMPYKKKMVLTETSAKNVKKLRDRLEHFNTSHDCGMRISKLRKKNQIEITKLYKHRVIVLGAKEKHAEKEKSKLDLSQMPSAY